MAPLAFVTRRLVSSTSGKGHVIPIVFSPPLAQNGPSEWIPSILAPVYSPFMTSAIASKAPSLAVGRQVVTPMVVRAFT